MEMLSSFLLHLLFESAEGEIACLFISDVYVCPVDCASEDLSLILGGRDCEGACGISGLSILWSALLLGCWLAKGPTCKVEAVWG